MTFTDRLIAGVLGVLLEFAVPVLALAIMLCVAVLALTGVRRRRARRAVYAAMQAEAARRIEALVPERRAVWLRQHLTPVVPKQRTGGR